MKLKNKPLVFVVPIRFHSWFSSAAAAAAAAPLHHPPTAPAVRHLADINLISSSLIPPPISSSSSLAVSLVFCVYEVNPPK